MKSLSAVSMPVIVAERQRTSALAAVDRRTNPADVVSGRARSATGRPNPGSTDDRGHHHRGGILNTQFILENALDIRFWHFQSSEFYNPKDNLVVGIHRHVHMH